MQRKVANDDGIVSRTAQLARQAVVVEPEPGIRLSRVLGERGGLPKAWGEWSSADFPAEHTGARRLWRWAPILFAIVAAATSRVVAMGHTALLLLIEDVAGVVVVGVAARVSDSLLYRRQLDKVMHCGCLCTGHRAY